MYTKIVDEKNKLDISELFLRWHENEKPLICFKKNSNWILLTNRRIVGNEKGSDINILHSDIKDASLALQEEFESGIKNKTDFSRVKLIDRNNEIHVLEFEVGKPFKGFYQVLSFLARPPE